MQPHFWPNRMGKGRAVYSVWRPIMQQSSVHWPLLNLTTHLAKRLGGPSQIAVPKCATHGTMGGAQYHTVATGTSVPSVKVITRLCIALLVRLLSHFRPITSKHSVLSDGVWKPRRVVFGQIEVFIFRYYMLLSNNEFNSGQPNIYTSLNHHQCMCVTCLLTMLWLVYNLIQSSTCSSMYMYSRHQKKFM